jgi:hypothetical protein
MQENHDVSELHGNFPSSSNQERRTFLALVPRGLQHKISSIVQEHVGDAQISIVGEGRDTSSVGADARTALLQHQQQKQKYCNPWFQQAVGSVQVSASEHISVGYTDEERCTWSVAGTLQGVVWMKIETQQVVEISKLRCLGPLLALVGTADDFPSLKNPNHAMNDLLSDFSQWVSSTGEAKYHESLDKAMTLWKEYVQIQWKEMLNQDQFWSLGERITENKLRFRLSSMRDQVETTYTRQDFLTEFMHVLGSTMFPSYPGSESVDIGWTVSLKQFDVEFVVICLNNGFMALGLSLLPYSFYDAKSFSKGVVPPDISRPYLGGETLDGLVRLRPTTAHTLLQLAKVQPFETVLDPCAGIGTIPLEADVFFQQSIGIGGDVVLDHPTIASAAGSMEQIARGNTQAPASLLCAWDAAHLPIRTGSIDVCVSDLPFGKQCLSTNALRQLLPILFLECARILTLNYGRIVMLCGSPGITESLEESRNYWKIPCTIATPVNIGGLQAWIFRIERNGNPYNEQDHPRKLARVRTMAKKRDLVARHQKVMKESGITPGKKRRIQS